MATEKISDIFDIQAINKQVSDVIKKIESVTAAMENSAEKIAVCNGDIASSQSFNELTKATGKFVKVNNEYVYQTKELIQLQKSQTQMEQKLETLYTQTAKDIEEVRQKIAEQTKVVRDSVKAKRDSIKTEEEIARIGKINSQSITNEIDLLKRKRNSVGELNAENKRLRDLAKSMDVNSQATEIQQINTVINSNTALVELNSDAYVKQKMNIGNYKSAVDGLDLIMKSLGAEMKRVAASGGENSKEFKKLNAEFQKAQVRSAEFSEKIGELSTNTTSLKGQMREMVEQMVKMEQSGQRGTEAYAELSAKAGALKDAIGDVNQQIKNMASDTANFDAILSGIQGISGGFQAFQGVMGFCNMESEEFEKIQAKVQSAMAITNGLTAIANALNKDSAMMVGLGTAAQSKNIIVSKVATIVQIGLNAAMKSFPLMLVIGAIVAGVVALGAWIGAAKDASAEQKRLNEINDKAVDGYAKEKMEVEGLAAKIKNGNTTREDQANMVKILNQLHGESFTKNKSLKELEDQFLNDAPAYVEMLRSKAKAQAAFDLAIEKEKELLLEQNKSVDEYVGSFKRMIIGADIASAVGEAQKKAAIEAMEVEVDAFLSSAEASNKTTQEIIENNKFKGGEELKGQAESLKAIQQSGQLRIKAETDAQSEILSDTKASYKEKLAALGVYTQKQIEAVKMQRDAELNGKTNKDERVLIAQKAEDDILKINKQGAKEREKLDEQEAQIIQQRANVKCQVTMDASQRILDDDKSTYEQKIAAQDAYEEAQKESIRRKAQMEMEGLDATSNQALLINDKLEADLSNIKEKGIKDRERLEQQEVVKQVAKMDFNSQNEIMNLEKQQSDELVQLSRKYAKGKMSEEQYGKDKLAIVTRYNQLIFDEEMKTQTLIANMLTGEDKVKALQVIKQKQLEFTKHCNEQEVVSGDEKGMSIEDQEKLMKEMKIQLAQETVDAIFSITNSMFERKIQEVDEEIEKIDEQKEHDLEVIEEMDISDEEREERKKVVEAKAEAEKAKLEKKKQKLQLEQAKMQKAQAIVQAIINTALGITNISTSIPFPASAPFIAVLSAMGALQIAAIAAQPLPKYADGIDNHPGGLAVVGDGGRRELVKTLEGGYFVTPDIPTLVDLPKHAQVLPDFNLALQSLSFTPTIQDTIPTYDFVRLEQKIDNLEKAFVAAITQNRPQFNVNLDKNGLWSTYEKQKGRTTYINERLNIQR